MASSALAPPPPHPFFTLRYSGSPHRSASSGLPSLPAALFPSAASPKSRPCCRSSLLILSSSSNARPAYVSEKEQRQRKILESYGLDPSDFISPAPDKSRRRRDREERAGKGKGKHVPPPPKEPKPSRRKTHRMLQVLAGTARRRKLLSPEGMDVRPMMQVVKGAAFDIIQVAGGCPASLKPGRWLDLYSGTGSVGIEAMSRGCAEAHFVEIDPWVASKVLRPNLEWTGFSDVSVIHMIRVERFLEQAEQCSDKSVPYDYISVTPPYTAVDYPVLMDQLGRSPLVGEDCFMLVEYPLETSITDSCGHLIKIADRRFGRTNLAIYGPSWAEKKRKSRKDIKNIKVTSWLEG